MNSKPQLSFFQIWNMSFGFLGIQFGFALQGGFMSRIFQSLGAMEDELPLLWIAAPLTGLLVQPIIGYWSDRTWHPKLGRRRPFFLIGAVLASLVLFFVPHSPILWIAVGCLWILDASINISMEPFRALVADKLPDNQRSYGFMVQTLIIGIGTWVASQLPRVLNKFGVSNEASPQEIPDNVTYAFAIGAVVFLGSILYTIFTTTEYPPDDLEALKEKNRANSGLMNGIKEISQNIVGMPRVMMKLGLVQFFSWFAFFTMWSMANPALTEHVFHSPKYERTEFAEGMAGDLQYAEKDAAFNTASDLVGSAMGVYGLSAMVFAFILTLITSKFRINRKYLHLSMLIAGGMGFLLMLNADSVQDLQWCFVLIGLAWGSILSMPYAMLSSAIDPEKMGVFMGIFNMFIVIPQIFASAGGINFLYKNLLGEDVINTMVLAGISLILGGLSNLLIKDKRAIMYQKV